LGPNANAANATLDKNEAADSIPQAVRVFGIKGLIAVIAPQTKASLSRHCLKCQQLGLTQYVLCARIDDRQAGFRQAMTEIETLRGDSRCDPDGQTLPAIAVLSAPHEDLVPDLGPQP
jgi:hypothetical protein